LGGENAHMTQVNIDCDESSCRPQLQETHVKILIALLSLGYFLAGCKSTGNNSSATYDATDSRSSVNSDLAGKAFMSAFVIEGSVFSTTTVEFTDSSRIKWTRPLGFSGSLTSEGTYEVSGNKVTCKFEENPYGWQLREFEITADGNSLIRTKSMKKSGNDWVANATTPGIDEVFGVKGVNLGGKKFINNFIIQGSVFSTTTLELIDSTQMVWTRPLDLSGQLKTKGTYEIAGNKVICKFKEDPYGWQLRELDLSSDGKSLTLKRSMHQTNGNWQDFPPSGLPDLFELQ
jgi:hypothetical protein